MQPPGIPTKTEDVNWDYDQEADVLYIGVGEPVKALGLDIGEGVIVRYSEERGEVVGLTIIGIRERSLRALRQEG